MASEGTERRLAAVLMADVVGYSRLMAEDQDATVRTVTAYREEVELLVRQHQGRLVDFTGDEFLAEFPSAMYALQCGVEIQRLLSVMNTSLPVERRMQFRMGAHLAEVRVEGERFKGPLRFLPTGLSVKGSSRGPLCVMRRWPHIRDSAGAPHSACVSDVPEVEYWLAA